MSTTTSTSTHRSSATCPPAIAAAELRLEYLAEGAANIIYNVSVTGPADLVSHSDCCVMRLRKDIASTKPARQVALDFETHIVPLFAHDTSLLLEHVLYKLSPSLITTLNGELRELDSVEPSTQLPDEIRSRVTAPFRHLHRRHVYLPRYEDEPYGILMQNLDGPGVRLVEFKPKWLVQSPSAPATARNCRTCALNAMRRHVGKFQGRGDSGFCPFDLLSTDATLLKTALTSIWPYQEGLNGFVDVFRRKVQPALRHLAVLQRRFGGVGVQDFRKLGDQGRDSDAHALGVAMALRDCSVFLALQRKAPEEGAAVEIHDVKLADLDLKSVEGGKVQKWAAMEQQLLDDGWYERVLEVECAVNRV